MTKTIQLTFFLFLMPFLVLAQSESETQGLSNDKMIAIAKQHLVDQHQALGLTLMDVNNIQITDHYINSNNGWTQIYFVQSHNDIQVHQALYNLTLKPDGTIVHSGNRFVSDIYNKIDSDAMILTAEEAIISTARDLGITDIVAPTLIKKADDTDKIIFTAPYAHDNISARPKYVETTEGFYRLAWEVYIDEKGSSDTWYSYVDAVNAEIITKRNNTVYCEVHGDMFHNHSAACNHDYATHAVPETMLSGDGAKYKVFALPAESPLHGPFITVEDPSIETASPYGWHDVDAADGAEYTITRGNNVWAYEDTGNNNSSIGNEPDGGPELVFEYDYDIQVNPFNNMEADVTGMFYMCNMIHDLTHTIGFDSQAGAFQENTYGTGGRGGDPVRAEALDGSGTDNANFATPDDGTSGRMQMFRWVFSELFRVLEPADIAKNYVTGEASWDLTPDYNTLDFQAEIVVAKDDDPQFPERGCGEISNDIEGKIAIIMRGECLFGTKALNAQNAGAVAVIICNVPGINGADGESTLGMGPGDPNDPPLPGNLVTIPVTSLAYSDCIRIVEQIEKGTVIGEFNNDSGGPGEVSSGFDNGVIAHEYGHGISNRLIGGPSISSCLSDGEQMGEGISDYFSLITTTKEGDKGTDARGIGNFVDGQKVDGRGIRRFPYSTDMSICPLTYDFIKGQGVHATGEVWAAVLWDIYWAFSDMYGWSADWSDDSAGNVRAMKMAIDGMKMAPCNPGFIDMREALFAADNGEHTCMLWEIFARRGLGYLADQGSINSVDDGTENFEPLPTCIPTLKIKKEIGNLVTPGDELEVTIDIANHTMATAENVIITDVLSPGLSIVPGSTSIPYEVSGGNTILFELGNMETLEERQFSYRLATDPNISSITKLKNGAETSEEEKEWSLDVLQAVNTNYWGRTQRDAFEGDVSWFVVERDAESDQRLIYPDLQVIGDKPALRFWHRPNCIPIENGGFVEVSTDGIRWNGVDDMFIRGGYNNPITYANLALPGLRGFSGMNPNGTFYDSYVDLSSFKDQTISVRFRFATHDIDPDVGINFGNQDGWFIDALELMDIKKYTVEASISADNAETVEDGLREIIIDSDGIEDGTSTDDLAIAGVAVFVSPNPAIDNVTMKVTSDRVLDTKISLLSLDGRILQNQSKTLYKSDNYINIDVSSYEAGFYLLQLRSGDKLITKKLIIE